MENLSVAKGLNLPDLILSLLLWSKINIGYETFFAHNVMVCNSVTFKFWATLELFRGHGKGLYNFIINDWKYSVFWKKLTLNQVLHFESP